MKPTIWTKFKPYVNMRKDMKTFPVKKVKVQQNVSVVIVYAFLYQYLYVRLFKRLIKSDGFSRIAFAAKGQRRLVVNAAVSPAVAAAERRQGQATDGSGYRSSAREREPGAAPSRPRSADVGKRPTGAVTAVPRGSANCPSGKDRGRG